MKQKEDFPFYISSNLLKKIEDNQWVEEQFESNKMIQEILEVSDQRMDQFFFIACNMLKEKKIQESLQTFLFLLFLNSNRYDYWLGLGSANLLQGNYEGAIDAFEMSAMMQPINPIPYFYLSKCLFSMHDRINALQAIELALEYSKENDEFEEIYRQALLAKSLIVQEKEN